MIITFQKKKVMIMNKKAPSRLIKATKTPLLTVSPSFLLTAFFSGVLSVFIGSLLSTHTIKTTVEYMDIVKIVEKEKLVYVGFQPDNEIEKMLCDQKYEWNCELMSAIAMAESGQKCDALNTTLNRNGTWDAGLLMVNEVHGYSQEEMLGCQANIEAAYKIWKSQGYKAWSVVKNNSYLRYL